MALRRFTARVLKSAADGKPHAFRALKVGEVSLVTDPAILTEEEVEGGAGLVVIKMADKAETPELAETAEPEVTAVEMPTPEVAADTELAVECDRSAVAKVLVTTFEAHPRKAEIAKTFAVQDDEDLLEVFELLAAATLDKLATALVSGATGSEKAEWARSYINDLPDSAFLLVESGGKKDAAGKTVPRTLRHFPVRNNRGHIDLPHLRNAIARAPQAKIPGFDKDNLEKLQKEARQLLAAAQKLQKTEVSQSLYPLRITNKEVVFVDYWDYVERPTETFYYKLSYDRDADGDFVVGDPITMRLEFQEVGEDTITKVMSPQEKAMKLFKGFRLGENQTITVKATPGGEYGIGDEIVVKVTADGEPEIVHDGFELDEEGFVVARAAETTEVSTDEEEAEKIEATVEPTEEESTGGSVAAPSIDQALRMMAKSGHSFSVSFAQDGSTTISTTSAPEVIEPPAEVVEEVEETAKAAEPTPEQSLEEARKAAAEAEASAVEAKKAYEAAQEQIHLATQRQAGGGTDLEAAVDAVASELETKKSDDKPTEGVFKTFPWASILPGTSGANPN